MRPSANEVLGGCWRTDKNCFLDELRYCCKKYRKAITGKDHISQDFFKGAIMAVCWLGGNLRINPLKQSYDGVQLLQKMRQARDKKAEKIERWTLRKMACD